jgi:hypothetical protein
MVPDPGVRPHEGSLDTSLPAVRAWNLQASQGARIMPVLDVRAAYRMTKENTQQYPRHARRGCGIERAGMVLVPTRRILCQPIKALSRSKR